MNVKITSHFTAQVKAKGLDPRAIITAINSPTKITQVRRYPGQTRRIAAGVAVVGRFEGDTFVAITAYLDGVRTPLRTDQMNDPAALASKRALR